jgi:hypothetical protein
LVGIGSITRTVKLMLDHVPSLKKEGESMSKVVRMLDMPGPVLMGKG